MTPEQPISPPEYKGDCECCGYEVEREGRTMCNYCARVEAYDLYQD